MSLYNPCLFRHVEEAQTVTYWMVAHGSEERIPLSLEEFERLAYMSSVCSFTFVLDTFPITSSHLKLTSFQDEAYTGKRTMQVMFYMALTVKHVTMLTL